MFFIFYFIFLCRDEENSFGKNVLSLIISFILDISKEEKLRGRPGYEHLNEPLHILIEADLPANIVDIRLRQAQEIIEELLKPVVVFYIRAQIFIQIINTLVFFFKILLFSL